MSIFEEFEIEMSKVEETGGSDSENDSGTEEVFSEEMLREIFG